MDKGRGQTGAAATENFIIWVSFPGNWNPSHTIELSTITYYSFNLEFESVNMAERRLGKEMNGLVNREMHMWSLKSDKIPAPSFLVVCLWSHYLTRAGKTNLLVSFTGLSCGFNEIIYVKHLTQSLYMVESPLKFIPWGLSRQQRKTLWVKKDPHKEFSP